MREDQDTEALDSTAVVVDLSVFPREAVLRASYWLAEDADISISPEAAGRLRLEVRPRSGQSAQELCRRLRTALVDFAVRVDIEKQTADLRDTIWRTAFAELAGSSPR